MTENTEKKAPLWRQRAWQWIRSFWAKWDNLVIAFWILILPPAVLYVSHGVFGIKVALATTISAFFIATGGLYLAARRTAEMKRQNDIAQDRNAIDIFSRALERYKNDDPEVKVGVLAILRKLSENLEHNDILAQAIKEIIAMLASNNDIMEEASDEEEGEG